MAANPLSTPTTGGWEAPSSSVSKMIYYITRPAGETTGPSRDEPPVLITRQRAPTWGLGSLANASTTGTLADLVRSTTRALASAATTGPRYWPRNDLATTDVVDNGVVFLNERSPVTGYTPELIDYYSHGPGITGYGPDFATHPESGLLDYLTRSDAAFYCYGRGRQVCNPVLLASQPCVAYGPWTGSAAWVEPSIKVTQILIPVLIAVAFASMFGTAAVIFGRRKRETGSALNVYLGGHAIAALCYLICAGVLHYLTLTGGGVSTEYYARRRADLAIANMGDNVAAATASTWPDTTTAATGNRWWPGSKASGLERLDSYFFALSEAFWIIAIYTLMAAAIDRCVRWKRRSAGDSPLSFKRCGSWCVVWTVVAIYVFGLASSLPRVWMASEPWRRPRYSYGSDITHVTQSPRYFCRMYDWYVMMISLIIPLVALFLLSSFLLNVICRDRRGLRRRLKELRDAETGRFMDPGQPYILDSDERVPMVVPTGYNRQSSGNHNLDPNSAYASNTTTGGSDGGSGGLGTVVTPLRRPPPPPAYYPPYEQYQPAYGNEGVPPETQNLMYGNGQQQPATGYGQYNYNHNNSNKKRHSTPYEEGGSYHDDYNHNDNEPAAYTAFYDVTTGERGILRDDDRRRLKRSFWSRTRATFALAVATFSAPLLFGPFSLGQVWINRVQDTGPTLATIALSQIFQTGLYLYFVLHGAVLLALYDRFRHGCLSLCCGCTKGGTGARGADDGLVVTATSNSYELREGAADDGRGKKDGGRGTGKKVAEGSAAEAAAEAKKRNGWWRSPTWMVKRSGSKGPAYKRATEEKDHQGSDEDADFARPRPTTPMTVSMLGAAGTAEHAGDRSITPAPTPQYYGTYDRDKGGAARDTTVILSSAGSSLRGTTVITKMAPKDGYGEGMIETGGSTSTFKREPKSEEAGSRAKQQILLLQAAPQGQTRQHLVLDTGADVKLVAETPSPLRIMEDIHVTRGYVGAMGGGVGGSPVGNYGEGDGDGKAVKKKTKSAIMPCFGSKKDKNAKAKDARAGPPQVQSPDGAHRNLVAAGGLSDGDNMVEEVKDDGALYDPLIALPQIQLLGSGNELGSTALAQAHIIRPGPGDKHPDLVVYRSTTTTLSKMPKPRDSQASQGRTGAGEVVTRGGAPGQPRVSLDSADLDDIDDYIDSSGEHTRTDIGDDDYHYGTPLPPALGDHGTATPLGNAGTSTDPSTPTFPSTSNRSTAKIRYDNIVYNTSTLTSATRYQGDKTAPVQQQQQQQYYGHVPGLRPDPFHFPGSTEASAAAILNSSSGSPQGGAVPGGGYRSYYYGTSGGGGGGIENLRRQQQQQQQDSAGGRGTGQEAYYYSTSHSGYGH